MHNIKDLFEPAFECPDPDLKDRLDSLVALDNQKGRLSKILGLLINPDGLKNWTEKFYPKANLLTETILRRPPLIVLEGDVGSGKTELATTIGDKVARQEKITVTVLPLSLSARGQGMVGEMTKLISSAFDHTIEQAKKYKSSTGKARGAVILLVDEADALTQSRENNQMHHEDKSGVNAFIRGIDRLGNGKLPAAVIMCTNRISSLDPAVKRRAADILTFQRPNETQRRSVLLPLFKELNFSNSTIDEICSVTGGNEDISYGFSFSDLLQRLLPTIVLDAYPKSKVDEKRAIEIAREMNPTPPFQDR